MTLLLQRRERGETLTTGSELFASRPSIGFALFTLTGEWPPSGQSIRCPLPGHDDSTPSFNLFDNDADGVPQSYGCFGCGRRGDVVGLIAELSGLRGEHLVAKAELLAEAEQHVEGKTPTRKVREILDFGETIAALEANLSDVRLRGFSGYMKSKGFSADAVKYATTQWGWLPGPFGTAVVPHRSPDGAVTGIKYRTANRKWSADGSSWPHLYGAWRDGGRGTVVLCEGESDAIWAAYWLRSTAADILALPSGAGAAVTEGWLKQVEGRRLFLVFDSDHAGRKATGAWAECRPDSVVATLPEGQDLLSCGIPVDEVLRGARRN